MLSDLIFLAKIRVSCGRPLKKIINCPVFG
jgi:hypothetical protein